MFSWIRKLTHRNHIPEVVGAQPMDIPFIGRGTVVLIRCKKCYAHSTQVVPGEWTLEQLTQAQEPDQDFIPLDDR